MCALTPAQLASVQRSATMSSGAAPLGTCLVVGGRGLIGRAVAAELSMGKHDVTAVVVCDLRGPTPKWPSDDSRFRFVELDVVDAVRVADVFQQIMPDTVFVAVGTPDFRPEASEHNEAVHVSGTQNILRGCQVSATVKREFMEEAVSSERVSRTTKSLHASNMRLINELFQQKKVRRGRRIRGLARGKLVCLWLAMLLLLHMQLLMPRV